MVDAESGEPVPILSVRICPTTGRVLPVGGVKPTVHGIQPIIAYEMHQDIRGGPPITVHGACVRNGQVSERVGGGILDIADLFVVDTQLQFLGF